MEENLFPSQFAIHPHEIEEERRLLYVAITRAMEQCHLSFAKQRFRNGSFSFESPSRFLRDIDRQYFSLQQSAASHQYSRPSEPSIPSFPRKPIFSTPVAPKTSPTTQLESDWKAGDRVSHRVFGIGTVNRVYRDEVTENDKIEIAFDTQGTKTLLLTHAKLERI